MNRNETGSGRLLFLLPFAPRLEADHGGARAIAELLRHLPARYRIAALYLRSPSEPPPDEVFLDRCAILIEVARPGAARGLRRRVARGARLLGGLVAGRPTWASRWWVPEFASRARALVGEWRPDVVQAEFSVMGQYLASVGAAEVAKVLTVHEPGVLAAEHAWRRSRGLARLGAALELRAWKRFERNALDAVDVAVAFTDDDRQALLALAGSTAGARFARIPIGVSIPEPLPPRSPSAAPILLFVGNFSHPPNADAALRLARAIFPEVRRAIPEAELRLIGGNPTPEMLRIRGAGIQVMGYVPDLRPHLQEAAVVVAPLRMGGGMRVKVLEALAHGRAVIGSRLAAAGLDVEDGEHMLLAETDSEFSTATIRLLADPELTDRIGRAGRSWAERHAGWEITAQGYDALYRSLVK